MCQIPWSCLHQLVDHRRALNSLLSRFFVGYGRMSTIDEIKKTIEQLNSLIDTAVDTSQKLAVVQQVAALQLSIVKLKEIESDTTKTKSKFAATQNHIPSFTSTSSNSSSSSSPSSHSSSSNSSNSNNDNDDR